MVRDLGGSLWGALVFALALIPPGYLVARWLHGKDFRELGLREQLAWSIALSFGIGTLAIVASTWILGVVTTVWLLAAIGLLTAIVVWRARQHLRFDITRRSTLALLLTATLWATVVLLSLTDLGIGHSLWMSVTSYDHSVRVAFVDAVMRSGVPPVNPMYWPGHAAPMRYYYFWYVTCGVVAQLAHISARQAFVASCIWPLAGVGAALALTLRSLLGWRGPRLTRAWWMTMALLAVTGLDLLASLGTYLGGGPLEGDMEWWSVDQVTSWADSFLWVPHHVAALVCCVLCALLLWLATQQSARTQQFKLASLAGICFASAFGLSTYIAAGTAILLVPWFVWRLCSADRVRALTASTLAAVLALLLLAPYLFQLLHHEAGSSSASASVLGFGVRRIVDPAVLNDIPGLHALRQQHPLAEINLAALLLLVPGYITELGFFTLVLILGSRHWKQKDLGERTLLFWTWSGLAAVTFIRSQVLSSNDYGFRASLLFQFFLLPLAVIVLQRSAGWQRRTLLGLAAIGMLGSVYQVVVLRTYLPWHEVHGDPAVAQLAERNYALRDAFATLDSRVPPNARIQFAPAVEYVMFSEMLQANRQVINADPGCDTSFGGETAPCAGIQRAVNTLYSASPPDAATAIGLCSQLGAQYLVATQWDTAWHAQQSWIWTLPAVVERPDVRIVSCKAS